MATRQKRAKQTPAPPENPLHEYYMAMSDHELQVEQTILLRQIFAAVGGTLAVRNQDWIHDKVQRGLTAEQQAAALLGQ